MRVIDPGHDYMVRNFDQPDPRLDEQRIIFMKREGAKYPGNVGSYYGTNCQELLRVLVDRVRYLDRQLPCKANARIITHLTNALYEFEQRAASRHGRELVIDYALPIEAQPFCPTCGHIGCAETCASPSAGVHAT